jgi:alcohol dehydrogenase class IV
MGNGESMRSNAEKVPKAILELMSDVELPTTLKQVNFPKADLEPFADYIVKKRQYVYNLPKYNPRRLTLENMVKLMHDMYEGALEA